MKAAIDRCFPLEQIGEAHQCIAQGYKKGNEVIPVAHGDQS
jgi:hypothetical protein